MRCSCGRRRPITALRLSRRADCSRPYVPDREATGGRGRQREHGPHVGVLKERVVEEAVHKECQRDRRQAGFDKVQAAVRPLFFGRGGVAFVFPQSLRRRLFLHRSGASPAIP